MRNSISLSSETEAKAQAAQQAWGVLRKTFFQWTVIGAGVVALRERADDLGGRNTFKRLLEQQGLGSLAKAKAVTSRLEKIMANLPEVMAWHQKLDEKQQIDWGSPSSVIRHCPIFLTAGKTPARGRTQPVVAKPENLAKVMEQQEARIDELLQEIEAKDERIAAKLQEAPINDMRAAYAASLLKLNIADRDAELRSLLAAVGFAAGPKAKKKAPPKRFKVGGLNVEIGLPE